MFLVYGNHDDDLQNASVLAEFSKLVGITPAFDRYFFFESFKIHCEHGQRFDKINNAEKFADIPTGRLVTQELSAYLERQKAAANLLNTYPNVRRPFGKIDSITDYIAYINCLKEKGFLINKEKLLETVDEKLNMIAADFSSGKKFLKSFLNFLRFGTVSTMQDIQFILGALSGSDTGPTVNRLKLYLQRTHVVLSWVISIRPNSCLLAPGYI